MLRYKDLDKLASKFKGYIVTGHHQEDYLETLLVQLIRGAGLNSLKTLGPFENNRFRPLVLVPNPIRLALLQNSDWEIFEDESNDSEDYLRNRLRKKVLPILLEEGANPEKIYRNFHELESPRTSHRALNEQHKTGEEQIRRISRQVLESESSSICKYIIDTHLKSLGLHPISTNFLKDLIAKIDSRSAFSLENKESWFWKSVSSDLYILPKYGLFFKESEFDQVRGFLKWNGKTKRIPSGCTTATIQEGDKIFVGGIHREVTELLREREIPVPIRKMLPILKRGTKTVLVCLRMWDARAEDICSDDFRVPG
ncbi:tRNA(Ile)-lysidine synthetase [Leptospira perolatii]|uniref:tRNA(Ile)-lysidine synthetase n=1 Tax=Leptospira perolatii TaxID=2023191 RepID=A0A2M9ZRE1_9LEPT|nr:ATP-binding protein [Leptospira perolatii]PJZ71118.1 tRNA(Ile)-lysidine synthetase [Leptospira perolatii]PJZ74650.1 tRNA(Ile)-lysidine synthetase [Leptospira perolatii]